VADQEVAVARLDPFTAGESPDEVVEVVGRGDLDAGGYLTPDARRTVNGRPEDLRATTTFSDAITANMRDIVRFLNEGRPYRPFLYRWR